MNLNATTNQSTLTCSPFFTSLMHLNINSLPVNITIQLGSQLWFTNPGLEEGKVTWAEEKIMEEARRQMIGIRPSYNLHAVHTTSYIVQFFIKNIKGITHQLKKAYSFIFSFYQHHWTLQAISKAISASNTVMCLSFSSPNNNFAPRTWSDKEVFNSSL